MATERDALTALADNWETQAKQSESEGWAAEGAAWRSAAVELRAALASAPAVVPVSALTYSSTQATECAGCGVRKHTPLRIDAMGGYVCLTCIDNKLGSMLGEFGHPEPAQPAPQAGAAELKTTQGMEMAILMNRSACRLYPENIDARIAFGRGWKEHLAAMQPAHPTEQSNQDAEVLVEKVAQAVYDQWTTIPGWRPWAPGGNATRQDDARAIARKAIAAARAAQAQGESKGAS